MKTDEQLTKEFSSEYRSIALHEGVWIVRDLELVHKEDAECDLGSYDPEFGGCEDASHYEKVSKTEFRNASLVAALKDAGIGGTF